MEKKDVWSFQQQIDARKLLKDIDHVTSTMETSFSIARAVRALMLRYKERWPD